jgi:chromosomal replication initiator protein
MKISHPKVKKIAAQAQRRIRKITGEEDVLLIVMKQPEVMATFDEVVAVVCQVRNFPRDKVFSNSRKRELVISRQLISYYARICSGMTLPAIGEQMGGQHHTTVMHSIETIRDLIETGNEFVYYDVKEINKRLKQLAALAIPAPTNGTMNQF